MALETLLLFFLHGYARFGLVRGVDTGFAREPRKFDDQYLAEWYSLDPFQHPVVKASQFTVVPSAAA